MSPPNFKVIVVGGGPVGLVAAHALTKANIDFLVLERRSEIVIDAGSNLVLSPVGLRTLAQLGIQDAIFAVSSPLGVMDRMDHKGRNIGDSKIFLEIEKTSGMAPRVISRHDLTKVLYDTLPLEAQQKIVPNSKLADIITGPDSVTAVCADGSSYEGSTVIGADGAHSVVRDLMRRLAVEAGSTEVNTATPFLTTYRALWVRFPKPANLPVGFVSETHGRNAATQLFVGEESGVIGVYDRLAQPTKERIRHTKADQEALVDRLGHMAVTPNAGLTLRDMYDSRLEAGLVSLEEGVVDHWSWNGQIALAGDAAHKFTPSTGAGCNNGMIDIVALVNELHAVIGSPSRDTVAAAFTKYENTRRSAVEAECAQSGRATTMATWQSGLMKFIDLQVMSLHLVQRFIIGQGAKKGVQTPACEFVKGGRQQAVRV